MTAETVRAALADFVARVTRDGAARIRSITLYGSWARGTARPDSDIDVLVVVDQRDAGLVDRIQGAALDVDLDRLTCLSVKVCPEAKADQMQRIGDPFWANIQREGVTLWTPRSKDASATV